MGRLATVLVSLLAMLFAACAEVGDDSGSFTQNTIYSAKNQPPVAVVEPLSPEEYEKKCIRREYYFCPQVGIGPLYRIEVVKDICQDPPEVLSISECQEFLECDPSQFKIGEEPCTTAQGLPGMKMVYCDKGVIKEGECITDCLEEICDGLDNDCDDEIDEGQLNACGECGPDKIEECDGVDNDCNGFTDENLYRPCSTACGDGYETCVNGNWLSCTAQQPSIEVCNGFDDDCDGQVDEGLDCLCTMQDIGTLFPCDGDPLICGQGYHTCECKNDDCTVLGFTPCYALCYYQDPVPDDCEPTIGMALEKEKCNNHDDNCNQLIDEDLVDNCYTGPTETLGIGICKPGEVVCEKGQWGNYDQNAQFIHGLCLGEILPEDEDHCNGVDDDCDGSVDQDVKMKDTDILFIIDWSGSMKEEISAILMALNKFAGFYKDEDVIKWGLLVGPKTKDGNFGSYNYLKMVSNLKKFEEFIKEFASLNQNDMNGQYEMIYDAIYLSILNITSTAPWQANELAWAPSGVSISESEPTLENFEVDWRPNIKRVIIVFSDEYGQSYLIPKSLIGGSWNTNVDGITQDTLLQALNGAPNTVVYTFSTVMAKEGQLAGGFNVGWAPVADATGGEWFKLSFSPTEMYSNLMKIIDKEVCGQ
tara:strand:- start:1261 stop:3198 length:1938 start_codon:yes stop_codon:yes gene_type:complete